MGIVKYIITAMMVATIAVSCIKDKDAVEFRQRPTMLLDFAYLNVDNINTIDKEVERVDILIYSPGGELYEQHHVKKSEIVAHDGIVPLYGVPEGEYRVVCVANKTNINIEPASSIEEGILSYPGKVVNHGCDSLFMSLDTITVKRGRPHPEQRTIELKKKYYMLNVEITGAKELNRPKEDFRVQLVGVPNGFDLKGYFSEEVIIIKPSLDISSNEDLMQTSLALNEFNYKSNVMIELFDRTDKIGSLDLKKKIVEDNIDITQKDLEMKVKIEISTIGNTIVVKDWELNPIQSEDIGK